ncbi:MAG: glycosyltransferase [Candidatus Neomarinimicrobiota bacterium]
MTRPDISIIIVSYNVKNFLQHCLLALKKAAAGLQTEIFVVDNHSIDGTPDMLRREFPDLQLISNETNLGFGKANNQALKLASGKYVLFLNPDTLIEENTLSVLYDFMEKNGDVGICGPRILNADGTLQLACRRSFPSPRVALPKLLGLSALFPKSKIFGKYNLTYLDPGKNYPVDAVSGSFMFCHGDLIRQIKGFDEDFFMYGEDLDLCRRVQLAGKKVYYVADTAIIHYKGESSKSAPYDSLMAFYKAMDIFFRKHFSPFYSTITTLFFRIGIAFHLLFNFLGRLFFALRLPLLDLLMIIAALLLSLFLRFPADFFTELQHFAPVLGGYAAVYMLFLALGGSYRRAKHYDFVRAAANLLPGFVLNGFVTFFFLRAAQSRFIFLIAFVFILIVLMLWRIIAFRMRSRHFRQGSENARRTLVVGAGPEGQRIAATLGLHPELGYLFVGFVDRELQHPKTIGSIRDLSQLVKIQDIDNVIFSSDVLSLGEIIRMMAELAHFPLSIKIIPEKENRIFGKAVIENLDDIPVIEMEYAVLKPEWRILKRSLDLFFALIAILVLVIPAALIALTANVQAVKFSEDVPGGRIWRRKKDGSEPFLYWYPMLFSLLSNRMTIVGDLKNIPEGSRRYYKPGMTSIMRSEKAALPTPEEHERYIHYYMSNFSFVLDVEIIFKTLFLKKN